MNLPINERQQATLLAALRYYQGAQQYEPEFRDDWMQDLATNGGALVSLTAIEVDDLVTLLQFPEEAVECNDCTAVVDPNDPYHGTPCGSFCDDCMKDHMKECEICAKEFEADFPEDVCEKCGDPTDDGEGYDGLCGNCADKEYKKQEH